MSGTATGRTPGRHRSRARPAPGTVARACQNSAVDMLTKRLRVAAYGICVRDSSVLLARYIGGDRPRWTLPGGGIDHGEDPYDAVRRELVEETGFTVRVTDLLGVHSWHDSPRRGTNLDYHGLRVIYLIDIVGGELRNEVGGTTDRAEWFDLDAVGGLDRVALVDYGLDLYRERPADGHPPRVRFDT
ncbi:MAG: NUDIX hydrolase [Actinocatenispora sp.]